MQALGSSEFGSRPAAAGTCQRAPQRLEQTSNTNHSPSQASKSPKTGTPVSVALSLHLHPSKRLPWATRLQRKACRRDCCRVWHAGDQTDQVQGMCRLRFTLAFEDRLGGQLEVSVLAAGTMAPGWCGALGVLWGAAAMDLDLFRAFGCYFRQSAGAGEGAVLVDPNVSCMSNS